MRRLGIDIGSRYLSSALIEGDRVVESHYREHRGESAAMLGEILQSGMSFETVGVTGQNQEIDGMLAMIAGARFLLPGCRNVFALGAQTFSLIFFDERGNYREHSVNPSCASGTGSFIEEQAQRLGISAEEVSRRAGGHQGKTPKIATRCAVFAKTDIVHAMQEGHSLPAICAGLCDGIARSVLDLLVKGRDLESPVGAVGGVSLSARIVAAIGDILGERVIVPEHSQIAGAIGAALLGKNKAVTVESFRREGRLRETRRPLRLSLSDYPDFSAFDIRLQGEVEVMLPRTRVPAEGVYIGIDIGSTSTKAAVVNNAREVVGGFYTATRGEPIAAVEKILAAVDSVMGLDRDALLGAGTTGSGRKIIAELFRADMEVDEISAHAKAAVHLHPGVDTVIEIGGQDAKFTRILNGDVSYSAMNYVCAAGTGSFIEEQAKRLGVSLAQFSDMALGAVAPYTSDRCTVYMERDLSALLSEGWSRQALAAAVLYSIRDNYLSKVVNKSPIGDYVVFQGATARNAALVACFEELLQKPVHVSPYCHITGALGVALMCRETGIQKSGMVRIGDISLAEEICKLCANHCQLTVAESGGVKSAWGMKCGRDYADERAKKPETSAPRKRLEEVMRPLYLAPAADSPRKHIKIGIMPTLYNADYAPLWHNFLSRLGFTVVVSKISRKTLSQGKKTVNSDFCAPMVIAHGAMMECLDLGVNLLFCPAVVDEEDPDTAHQESERFFKSRTSDAYYCYYSQYLPTILGRLTSADASGMIAPLICFHRDGAEKIARAIHAEMEKTGAGLSFEEVRVAFTSALEQFREARRRWGETYSAAGKGDRLRIALLGRPYVVLEPAMSLDLDLKLEELGAESFWQDEFDLDDYQLTYANKFYERMHWQYGKKIIKLAEYCARSENLFAVYLSCFRCSPDSFLIGYVKDIMAHYDKPFLVLQLDEHSSDVGYATRIEAALRSFRNSLDNERPGADTVVTRARNDRLAEGDTVLIPYLDQFISRFWAACFVKAGYGSQLLDADEKSLSTGYRYANGGECMPLVSIAGSAIEQVRAKELDPQRVFLYLPTVCMACNFPQFPIFADMAFQAAGLGGIKIGLINSMTPGEFLPMNVSVKILESNIVGCIVYKMYNRIKPYEKEKGDSDRALLKAAEEIYDGILNGKGLRMVLAETVARFKSIARDESRGRKPRIALIGDFYVKYNETVNQHLQDVVLELGGELIVPSFTEYPFHFYDADIRLQGDDPRQYRLLRNIEKRYEKIAGEIIGDQCEPDFAECVQLMEDYRIRHYLPGETSISIGRALYYIHHRMVDAIIHVNPMFCCPGVVSSSIYRKIQQDYGIPIIDIFYDGVGTPNKVLIPHLHYLRHKPYQI